jgi:hypothetical protein
VSSSNMYKIHTEGEVALAAAGTTKTIIGIAGNANFAILLKELWFDFDGVTSTNNTVKMAIARCTFATNPPGTNSTTLTVKQARGRVAGTGFAGGKNWTVEPTVIETVADEEFSFDPNKGAFRYPWPLGDESDTALGEGWTLRALVESGDTVSAAIRAGMRFVRT